MILPRCFPEVHSVPPRASHPSRILLAGDRAATASAETQSSCTRIVPHCTSLIRHSTSADGWPCSEPTPPRLASTVCSRCHSPSHRRCHCARPPNALSFHAHAGEFACSLCSLPGVHWNAPARCCSLVERHRVSCAHVISTFYTCSSILLLHTHTRIPRDFRLFAVLTCSLF
ncbi:hypothetical protein C8R45DRAFT_992617 [Mycena sanguinolenta]|nr:hypothetical protein C8R45DRAFT_992617 [Mycena sanguinolenta]